VTARLPATSSAGVIGCAFLYFHKEILDVGGEPSRGFGISETGIVAGDYAKSPFTPNRAAIFSGGLAMDIGVLPGARYSRANGINSNQYVVGYSVVMDGSEHAPLQNPRAAPMGIE